MMVFSCVHNKLSIFYIILVKQGVRRCVTSQKFVGLIDDFVIELTQFIRPHYSFGFDSVTEMITRNICWEISRPCVWLTALLPSCANCLDIMETSDFYKTMCLPRPVQGFFQLFFNIEDVMDLRYLRMKMGPMYSTEVFNVHKWTTSNNQVCTKLKELLHWS
jgi:hypothetical protein